MGYRLDLEGTIYARTLKHMSDEGSVVVELQDGRRISGAPSGGPQHKGDGVAELYLTYPEAQDDEGEWVKVGEGLIVPLAGVSTIALSEEPTGSASDSTQA